VKPDHVQLLVSVDAQFGIHRLMKLVKGRSSRSLRQEFPVSKRKLPTVWTNSYFVSTTGRAKLSEVKQHIEQQKHVEEATERDKAQKNVSIPHLSNSQASEQA
jgi:putative transposase